MELESNISCLRILRRFVVNEHQKARGYFEQAIGADSNSVMAYVDPTARFWRYTPGWGHYMQGEYEMALREWQPLVEAGYYWVWTYAYASDACLELGRPEEGLRIAEHVLVLRRLNRRYQRLVVGRCHRDLQAVKRGLVVLNAGLAVVAGEFGGL